MATKPAPAKKPAPAAAAPAAAPAEPAKKKKKGGKLVLVLALALLAGGGAAGWHFFLAPEASAETKAAAPSPKAPPVFVPVDAFTVNLATVSIDRYLQLGLTLEVASSAVAEDLKRQMPVIRSRMLMLLAAKTAEELATTQGKQKLMAELLAEARAPLPAGEAPSKGVEQAHFSAFVIQ